MTQETDNMGISAEDRQAMCDMLERLLLEHFDDPRLRTSIECDDGFDKDLWQKMAELGLLGVLVDEEHGGIGGGLREVEAFMEVSGKALFTSPYISSSVVAVTLLNQGSEKEAVQTLLGEIASGKSIVIPLGYEVPDFASENNDHLRAVLLNGQWQISGEVRFAQYIDNAQKLIFSAQADQKLHVYICDANAAEIERNDLPTNDQTLRLSNLSFTNVNAEQLFELSRSGQQATQDAALVAMAGEQAGASRETFDRTIDYLKTRYQFGRPIGSFQALKHMTAELLIEVESMISVARAAANAVDSDAAGKETLVSLAAFTCKDGFRHVAAESIQLHGGIAYTVEHFAHLYWRRAQSLRWLYGTPNESRERYLSKLEALI